MSVKSLGDFLPARNPPRGCGARRAAIRAALTSAGGLSGAARHEALATLGAQLNTEAAGSSDAPKVRLLASAVSDLAGAR